MAAKASGICHATPCGRRNKRIQAYSSVKVGIEVARGVRKFQDGYAKVLAARRVPSQANCQPWWSASRESRCCRNPPKLGCSRPARHIFDPITPPLPILSQKFKSTAVSSSRLRQEASLVPWFPIATARGGDHPQNCACLSELVTAAHLAF